MEIVRRKPASSRAGRRSVRAVIADLGADPPVLDARRRHRHHRRGQHALPARVAARRTGPGAFTRAVVDRGAGAAEAAGSPGRSGAPTRCGCRASYAFAGATASVGRSLALTRHPRHARIHREAACARPSSRARCSASPPRSRLSTPARRPVLTQLDGRLDAAAMGAFVPERLRAAHGRRRRLVRRAWSPGAQGTELRVDVDLKGLAIGLPVPLRQAGGRDARARRDDPRSWGRTRRRPWPRWTAACTGASGAAGQAGPSAGTRRSSSARPSPPSRCATGSGSTGTSPASTSTPGARRSAPAPGAGPAPVAAPAALELRGLDLRFGRAALHRARLRAALRPPATGRHRVARHAREPAGGRARSPSTRRAAGASRRGSSGSRSWRERPARPGRSRRPRPPTTCPRSTSWRERFEFHGHWLGRLELVAEAGGRRLAHRARSTSSNDHARFASSGAWRRTATGPAHDARPEARDRNLNALLGQFGYGDYVNRGEAKLEGQLVWPGYPYDFAPGVLSGRFKVEPPRRGSSPRSSRARASSSASSRCSRSRGA